MAIIQYGAGIDALCGSIGGWSFQKNRSGEIVRARGLTFKSPTLKQSISREQLVKYLQLYQAISRADKILWNTYADTWDKDNIYGDTKTLTGQNWFQSINYNRELMGLGVLAAPPAHVLPDAVDPYEVILSNTKIKIKFDPAFNPANNSLFIRTTLPISLTTTSFRQFTRITKVIGAGPYAEIDLTADWESTHELSWPPSANYYCVVIGVVVQTCERDSGIASPGVFESESWVKKLLGIGWMIIGSTNIIF